MITNLIVETEVEFAEIETKFVKSVTEFEKTLYFEVEFKNFIENTLNYFQMNQNRIEKTNFFEKK